jgi:hypothetical protein
MPQPSALIFGAVSLIHYVISFPGGASGPLPFWMAAGAIH